MFTYLPCTYSDNCVHTYKEIYIFIYAYIQYIFIYELIFYLNIRTYTHFKNIIPRKHSTECFTT